MTHKHPGRQARRPGPPLVADIGLCVDMTHKHFGRGGIDAKPLGYELINLGGGRNPVNLLAIIALIEKALSKKAVIKNQPFQSAGIHETWADSSKARRVLNWEPSTAPAEGFQKTVDWPVRNRSWLKNIRL